MLKVPTAFVIVPVLDVTADVGCSMSGLVLIAVAEVRHVVVKLGYWLRPFDMIADARRWRWDEPARCGLPAMTDEAAARLRAVLVEAITEVEPTPVVPVVAGDCVETVILVGEGDELRCTVAGVHVLHGNGERGVRWGSAVSRG